MKYLLLLLAFISFELFGQSEPVTQLINEDGSKMYAPKIRVPHHQTTKISSIEARLETENDNALKNPSFESPVIETLGTLGWSSNASKSFSTDAVDGKQAIVITGNTGLSRAPKIISTMIAINGATLANQIVIGKAWYKGAGLNNSSICILPTDGSGPVGADEVCTEFGDSNGLWITKIASLRVKSTYIGYQIILGSYTVSSNSETFDKAYASIYDPKDQATILGFKNDGSWQPVTLSSTGNINYSILNSFKQRSGDKLLLKGTLTWTGTGNANQIVISLPDNLTANIPDNTFINGLEYVRAVNEVGIIKTSGSGKTITLTGMRNYDGQTAIQDNGSFSTVFASGNTIPFYVSIPIAEWSENTNGALITCKEGPLKCTNTINANLTNAGIQQINVPNAITVSVSTNAYTINYSALGLTSIPTITATNSSTGAFTARIDSISTTSAVITTHATAAGVYAPIYVTITKTGSDYNAGYEKVLGFTEDADIRSTEWLTGGFDYISGKPIYRRCHKFTANTYTSGVNFTNWGTGLRIVGNPVTKQDSGYYILDQASFLDGSTLRVFSVLYEPSNGNVYSSAVNPLLNNGVRAGDVICANYTKP